MRTPSTDSSGVEAPARGWHLVMPVKLLGAAKSRLSGLGPARAELALALALDTVAAATRTRGVRGVLVVTDDERVAAALAHHGARSIPDIPAAGLNAALRHGVAQLRGDGPVAALTADLPALRPAELEAALAECAKHRLAFVPDAEGSGTTMLAARSAADFQPHFGPGSAAAHRAVGAVAVAGHLMSLRQDVDTLAGLDTARALGVGTRTMAVLAVLAGLAGLDGLAGVAEHGVLAELGALV